MRTFILAALLFLTATAAQAQQKISMPDLRDPKYAACTASADCARITMPCNSYASVNRAFQPEVQAWADRLAERVRCRATTEPVPSQPRCAAGKCTVVVP